MLRFTISFVSVFVTLGGGILFTIVLVKRLETPALVFPGILAIMAATFVVGLLTAPGRTIEERLRWFSGALDSAWEDASTVVSINVQDKHSGWGGWDGPPGMVGQRRKVSS